MADRKRVYIAKSQFALLKLGEPPARSTISICQPEPDKTGVWGCEIAIDGVLGRTKIFGEDSLQALCLAIHLGRQILNGHLNKTGSKLAICGPSGDFNDSHDEALVSSDLLFGCNAVD